MEPVENLPTVLFAAKTETGEMITIVFYPLDHRIHLGVTMIGRGTNFIGGRKGPAADQTQLGSTSGL